MKEERKRVVRQRVIWALFVIFMLLGSAISVGVFFINKDAKDVGAVAVDQAAGVEALCLGEDESVAPDLRIVVATALRDSGQCDKAQEVQEQVEEAGAEPAAPTTIVQEIDQKKLMEFVRGQVVVYCADRNECVPEVSVLVGIVADYLSQNPPQPGRAPTTEEMISAARSVIMEDPSLFKGDTGDMGPGASDEQVATQVAAYCAQQSGGSCEGVAGADGADGADGLPGPTCPEGTDLKKRQVTSTSDPVVQETWFVCVLNEPEPPTETTTTEAETPPSNGPN